MTWCSDFSLIFYHHYFNQGSNYMELWYRTIPTRSFLTGMSGLIDFIDRDLAAMLLSYAESSFSFLPLVFSRRFHSSFLFFYDRTFWISSITSKNASLSGFNFGIPRPTTSVRVSVLSLLAMWLAIWTAYNWPKDSRSSPPPPSSVFGVKCVSGRRLESGRAFSTVAAEGAESGTWICKFRYELWQRGTIIGVWDKLTHCERLPPWESVTRILSSKYVAVASVLTPSIVPSTLRDWAGNASGVNCGWLMFLLWMTNYIGYETCWV